MTITMLVLAFLFGGVIGFNFGAAYMIHKNKN